MSRAKRTKVDRRVDVLLAVNAKLAKLDVAASRIESARESLTTARVLIEGVLGPAIPHPAIEACGRARLEVEMLQNYTRDLVRIFERVLK